MEDVLERIKEKRLNENKVCIKYYYKNLLHLIPIINYANLKIECPQRLLIDTTGGTFQGREIEHSSVNV